MYVSKFFFQAIKFVLFAITRQRLCKFSCIFLLTRQFSQINFLIQILYKTLCKFSSKFVNSIIGKITLTQHQQGNSIILLKNFLYPSNFTLSPNAYPRINFGLKLLLNSLDGGFQIQKIRNTFVCYITVLDCSKQQVVIVKDKLFLKICELEIAVSVLFHESQILNLKVLERSEPRKVLKRNK